MISTKQSDIVGLVPAAGRARRLGALPCSKELYPIGFRRDERSGDICTNVVSSGLFEKFRRAGVTRAFVILREGKWDIPAYFREGETVGLSLAYLVITDSVGPPDTLDRAYSFVKHNTIAFGFPDILFGPDDVFEQLHARMDDTDAELVLGLYPAAEPADVDMVDLDNTGQVRGIFLKPKSTTLAFTWTCAVWRPGFTEIMHDAVKAEHASAESSPSAYERLDAQGDFPVGAVIKRAIEANLRVCGVAFQDQTFLDIGTPRSLARALRR